MTDYIDRQRPNYDCGEEVAYWAPRSTTPVDVVIIDTTLVDENSWVLRVQFEDGHCEDVHASRLTVME